MSNEDTRLALWKWRKEHLVEAWIELNTLLEASGVRREKAEARIQQLEEALEKIASAYQHMTLRERLVGEPSPARLVNIADAALSSSTSEAPEKKEEWMNIQLALTLDELLDEHEECLKENWENLPVDVQNQRLERVADVRRALARVSGNALEQAGEAPEKEEEMEDRPFKGKIIRFDKRLVIGGEDTGRPWLVIQHEDRTRDELGDWLRTYAKEGMRISVELASLSAEGEDG